MFAEWGERFVAVQYDRVYVYDRKIELTVWWQRVRAIRSESDGVCSEPAKSCELTLRAKFLMAAHLLGQVSLPR